MTRVDGRGPAVSLRPVDAASRRGVAGPRVTPGQQRFVAARTYDLSMCAYDDEVVARLSVV